MIKKILLLLLLISNFVFGQYNLDYFLKKAEENYPALKENKNLVVISRLQNKLDIAQNSAFNVSLTANYLFSPYFNNNGKIISTNPGPKAIGYDVGITNGGLYSAQINVDKNIFNGGILDAYREKNNIKELSLQNDMTYLKHGLKKEITSRYLAALQSSQLYSLTQEIVNNINDQLKISGNMVTQGYMNVSDYLLLKVELKNQKINLNEIYQQYQNNLYQLYSLSGIKDSNLVKLDSVNLQINKYYSSDRFLKKYYFDSLSTAVQQKVFETKYKPQVNLFFNTGLNAIEIDNIQRKLGFSAGVNFSLPIFDGNQRDLKQQQNTIELKTISDYKNYQKKYLKYKVLQSRKDLRSLRKNLSDLDEQINDYMNIMKISTERLRQGNLSMIEYLTILKNFINLRKNKINTEIQYQTEINNYNYWNW